MAISSSWPRESTATIPIVFALASDPVGSGLIASLARPGGNVTGFALFEYAIALKWLELLKAHDVPRLSLKGGAN